MDIPEGDREFFLGSVLAAGATRPDRPARPWAPMWGSRFRDHAPEGMDAEDFLAAVLAIADEADALRFFLGYIADLAARRPDLDGVKLAKGDLGWCLGEGMTQQQIAVWWRVGGITHPVFGRMDDREAPSMGEALARGFAAGLRDDSPFDDRSPWTVSLGGPASDPLQPDPDPDAPADTRVLHVSEVTWDRLVSTHLRMIEDRRMGRVEVQFLLDRCHEKLRRPDLRNMDALAAISGVFAAQWHLDNRHDAN